MSERVTKPDRADACCEEAKIMMLMAGTATLGSEITEYLQLATEWLKLADALRNNMDGEAEAFAAS